MKTKNVEEELYLASEIETTEQDTLSTASTAEETVSLYCASGSGSDCENCESNSNTWQTAYTLTLSQWMSERIVTELDEIWFKFTTNSSVHTNGGTALYTIQTRGGVDTDGELYADPEGEPLVYKDDGGVGYNFLIQEELSYNQTYYVRVMSIGTDTGDFEICVTATAINTDSGSDSGSNSGSSSDCGTCGSDCNSSNSGCDCESGSANDRDTAYTLPLSTWVGGSIVNETDAVWYKFTAASSGHANGEIVLYTIQTKGTLDTDGQLYTSTGTEAIAYDDDSGEGNNFYIAETLNYGETYYVKVMSVGPNTGDFCICVNDVILSSDSNTDCEGDCGGDYEGDTTTSGSITAVDLPLSGWKSGAITSSNDIKWYRFSTTASSAHQDGGNGRYIIKAQGDMDTVCTLYDVNGNKLVASDLSTVDLNAYIIAMLPYGNTYYVAVSGYTNQAGTHRIMVDYATAPYAPDQVPDFVAKQELPKNTVKESEVLDPIDAYSGAHLQQNDLLSLFGGQELCLTIHYNSDHLGLGDFGVGWSHNYEKKVEITATGAFVYEKPKIYHEYAKQDGSDKTYLCTTNGRNGYVLTQQDNGYCLNCNFERTEYYNTAGQLVKVVDHQGYETQIIHTDTGMTVTDSLTNQSIHLEKENGKVTQVRDDNGRIVKLTYQNDYLIDVQDVNGNKLVYTYNDDGRLETGMDNKATCYFVNTYDSSGRVATQVDGVNSPASCIEYDGNTRITTNRNGKTSRREFNDDGLLTRYVDECGNATVYSYDSNCNLISETDALNKSQTAEFNSFNKPIRQTDKNGKVTSYEYDDRGNVLKITYPDGGEETYCYNSRNQVTQHTDLRGTVTVYTYDANGMPATKKVGNKNEERYVFENGLLKSHTDARGKTTVYQYNDLGQMVEVRDPLNRATTFKYDLSGNLLKVIDPLGKSTSYIYDSNNQKIAEVDANNHKTRYVYNGNLKPEKIVHPDGSVVLQEYDGEDRLVKTTDEMGNITTYSYDDAGNLLSTAYSDGTGLSYEYDEVGNKIRETNPLNGNTVRTYDALGNVLTETDPEGNITRYEYDSLSRVIRKVNALSGSIRYTYNTAGDVLTETDALGNVTSYTYDAYGNRLTEKNPRGYQTTYAYDANGNKTSKTDCLGNVTTYEYDSCNQLIRETDAKNQTITYGYDLAGRRITVTDALGHTVKTTYDGVGNVLSITDAKNNVISTMTYTPRNLLSTEKDALARTTTYTYNAMGKVETVTDPRNNTKTYGYNSRGQNIRVTDPLGKISRASYNGMDQVTSLTGPLDGSTAYSYDSAGNLTGESTVSGGSIRYTYNALNLKEEQINARNQIRHYNYDAAGRITGYTCPEDTVSYTYDSCGNVMTVSDKNGTVERNYDEMNRMILYKDTFGNILRYQYDSVGNLISIQYPDETYVRYTYDANNNLKTVTDWADRVTTYTYDENNMVTRIEKPDGSVTTNTYDAAQRLLSTREVSSDDIVISGFEYVYDELGRIGREKDLAKNITMQYYYDELSRVTQRIKTDSAGNSTDTFAYDDAGNLTSDGTTAVYTYDSNNRLTVYKGNAVTYDADGNMLSATLNGTTKSFTYDSANRLVSCGSDRYTYNAEDTRIQAERGSTVTRYVYDSSEKLSRLLVETTNGVVTKYVYGDGLIGEEKAGSFYTYHFDYRGSTVAITDSTGTVTDTFEYDTYGKLTKHIGDSATLFLYNGRDGVMTELNGLCYMRARYYSPELKRFINADVVAGEISEAITLNRYAYANGNPVNNIDPFGLEAERGTAGKWILNGITYSYDGTASDFSRLNRDLPPYAYEVALRKSNQKRISYCFDLMAICTDGSADSYGSFTHQTQTAYSINNNGKTIYMDPTEVRYVVAPVGYLDVKNGDYAVVIDHTTGNYVYAIVGDRGPKGKHNEVSLKVAWDLGYTDASGASGPEGNFEVIYFPDTVENWKSINSMISTMDMIGGWYY